MTNNQTYKRWYDRDPVITRAVELIRNMPDEQQETFAVNLIQFINSVRKNNQEKENSLSIGKSRVLGLYKAFTKRRWYDKTPTLMSAMNILSTLPIEDCHDISEAIILTIEGN